MNIHRLLRRARSKVAERLAASAVAAANDRRTIARALGTRSGTGPHLLIASAGAGNIGDQAMVESFIEAVPGDIAVVTRGEADFQKPNPHAQVRFIPFAELLYGSGRARRVELRRFAELLSTAASLSIIGADIMDGKYSPGASVRRATLAEAAADAAIPTRILGFSWNATPHPRACAAMRRASRAGAVPLLRDPVSSGRARADGLVGVRDVADIVFTTRQQDPRVADSLAPRDRARIAVVNASALVGRGISQVDEYQMIVGYLLANQFHVVLLPHVSRPSSDDIASCAAVFDAVREARGGEAADMTLLDRLITPAQVRGLTARASIVVTGRMHLAIMALWNGIPAVTLATQGKVEGLMQMFGAPQLCVEPRAGMADEVVAVIEEIRNNPRLEAGIRSALPQVIALAERNIEPFRTPVPSRQSRHAEP